jgi:energy-converting hydrogenase Eha subunit C
MSASDRYRGAERPTFTTGKYTDEPHVRSPRLAPPLRGHRLSVLSGPPLDLLMDEPALRELARITARLSATLFVASLFAFAARRRVSPRVPVRLFAAFLASHGVHFSIVLLLAYVTGGANFRSRGGYPLTIAVGLLFAAGAVAWILRLRASEPTRALRLAGGLGIGFIWFAFTETYASRAFISPIFAIPTVVLIAAFLVFLNEWRRSPG